jgi:hypothetical protein
VFFHFVSVTVFGTGMDKSTLTTAVAIGDVEGVGMGDGDAPWDRDEVGVCVAVVVAVAEAVEDRVENRFEPDEVEESEDRGEEEAVAICESEKVKSLDTENEACGDNEGASVAVDETDAVSERVPETESDTVLFHV